MSSLSLPVPLSRNLPPSILSHAHSHTRDHNARTHSCVRKRIINARMHDCTRARRARPLARPHTHTHTHTHTLGRRYFARAGPESLEKTAAVLCQLAQGDSEEDMDGEAVEEEGKGDREEKAKDAALM